ncbi:uncharacterized protein LOC128956648 [Oppia nitens]|uniref:uncharacterized protein LOC128956648 n=1 Tax=Oppia nitens TaxID=1686743 RepID=UPI0023DB7FF7|nr:uncharacterized protein LOC128956648 [Oppia nitens]
MSYHYSVFEYPRYQLAANGLPEPIVNDLDNRPPVKLRVPYGQQYGNTARISSASKRYKTLAKHFDQNIANQVVRPTAQQLTFEELRAEVQDMAFNEFKSADINNVESNRKEYAFGLVWPTIAPQMMEDLVAYYIQFNKTRYIAINY